MVENQLSIDPQKRKLHEIPTFDNFIISLEKFREDHREALENSKQNLLPKDKSWIIEKDGSFTISDREIVSALNEKIRPPFSGIERLVESKNDFKIDFDEASTFYNDAKELAMKENENILSSREFSPDKLIERMVDQEMKDVTSLLEKQGQGSSNNPEVSALLDNHFERVEKLLKDFSGIAEQTKTKDLPELKENLKVKLSNVFDELKTALKKMFVDMKDRTQTRIENKVKDVKFTIHNSISEKVQSVNDKLKNVSESLDVRFQIKDKNLSLNEEKVKVQLPNLNQKEQGAEALIKVMKALEPDAFKRVQNTLKKGHTLPSEQSKKMNEPAKEKQITEKVVELEV